MANEANNFAEIISHCKEYGYIFQSSVCTMVWQQFMIMDKWVRN